MPSPNIGHLLYQSMEAALRHDQPGNPDWWYCYTATLLLNDAKAAGERLRASRHWTRDD